MGIDQEEMTDSQLAKLLRGSDLVPAAALKDAIRTANNERLPLDRVLIQNGIVGEAALFKEIARLLDIPFVDLTSLVLRKDILFMIPEPIASGHRMIPFEKTVKELFVATTDPEDVQTIEFMRRKTGLPIKVHITTPSGIALALKSYHRSLKAEFEDLTIGASAKIEAQKDLKELAEDLPIVRIVDSLLEHAMFENASDIHIEPSEQEITIRYRIDGILRPVMTLPKAAQDGVTARIKILSNLKLDEHRLPQDGRFKIETPDFKFSIRVSIMPVYDGEKVVMRLLPENAKTLTLEQLGFLGVQRKLVEEAITRPHGIIYATGPTGSGKTTTLYSLLGMLNQPGVNIITVEDPVEYRMPGVNQSQINPRIGYTFANGLRSILRQDPNVIMVGEIRDTETAEIAANAALTGHLVLSTLHTNDAPSAISRLADLGVAPFLVAFTTNLVVAQRLVRKVCKDCAITYSITKEELRELDRRTGGTAALIKDLVKAKELPAGSKAESLTLTKGKGCTKCAQEGFKGRVGIYEVLQISPKVASLIAARSNTDEIRNQALTEGMMTMFHDGLTKAMKGVTTLSEILRVTKE